MHLCIYNMLLILLICIHASDLSVPSLKIFFFKSIVYMFIHFSAAFCTAHCALDLAGDHVPQKCPLLLFYRHTDEDKLLAQPGPCTVEVREAADLTQKEFLSQ